MLDQRIKTPTDVNLVPDATLLGVIPMTTEDPSGPQAVEGVVQEDPSGLMAEAFRQVRTEIMEKEGIVGQANHVGKREIL